MYFILIKTLKMHSFSSHFILNRISKNVEIGQIAVAEPVRRPWRWPWPQRAQTLTTALTARRRAACRGHVTPWLAHLLARERPAGQVCGGGEKAAREISRQERAGASRGGWGRARCMPSGCGRCPATRARLRAHEDRTRTPRWPATAESPLSRRSRPVR